MALTASDVHYHASWIRNELRFRVASHGGAALKRDEYAGLLRFLEKLEGADVSAELVRASRADKALLEICEAAGGWPVGASRRAERVLKRWEKRLGPSLGELRPGLWDKGGRMHGCKKALVAQGAEVLAKHGNTTAISLQLVKKWVVDAPPPPPPLSPLPSQPQQQQQLLLLLQRANPAQYGDIGLPVGSWWIKPVCAFRDGMLDDPNSDVAGGEYGAYAIVLAHGVETETAEGTSVWRCIQADVKYSEGTPGALVLMRNMRNHMVVRIIRSCKLRSRLAPRAGFRYDGLYSVIGHGLKRVGQTSHYTFELKRCPNQDDIGKALIHPTADEYEDWMDYVKSKEKNEATRKAKADEITFREAINLDGSSEKTGRTAYTSRPARLFAAIRRLTGRNKAKGHGMRAVL